MKSNIWTRDQLVVALNLYWKIPYNKISGSSNSQIKEIAPLISRTPAALAYKLMNFTSLDPERQDVGNKGKSGVGSFDRVLWNEYYNEWEKLAIDSAVILSKFQNKPIEQIVDFDDEKLFTKGMEKESIVKIRLNQSDFRKRILASYSEKCCITGLTIPSLLVASHIIPWSKNEKERLNPRNGLCLNSIHDKAYDKGLITITTDYKIMLSKEILSKKTDDTIQKFFINYQDKNIILPSRFIPNPDFLEYHNLNIFRQ
jgi:putative restriction endonuclease